MRALREQPARVLANRPLEAAGKCSTGRGPVLPRGPTGQRQNPARPLALASLAKTFLASSGTPHEGVGCRGYVQICPGPFKGSTPLRSFPSA